MRIYVWEGGGVLRDYSAGLVVVAAPSEVAAWEALRAKDQRAYWQLKTGDPTCFTDDEGREAEIKEGFPISPKCYHLSQEHVFVKWGGA